MANRKKKLTAMKVAGGLGALMAIANFYRQVNLQQPVQSAVNGNMMQAWNQTSENITRPNVIGVVVRSTILASAPPVAVGLTKAAIKIVKSF